MIKLAKFIGRHQRFDLGVESAMRHHVFGGFWFAACLFVFWVNGERPGGQSVRQRVLVTLFGATLAIVLARLLGLAMSWAPPARDPFLAHLYPNYLMENINDNSFPSESTALYAAVAAGIFPLNRLVSAILFVLVVVFVSLPRVFVGGHYPADIFVGLILGLLAYLLVDALPDLWFHRLSEEVFAQTGWLRILGEFIVFVWISQIAVEFAEFVWVKNALEWILK